MTNFFLELPSYLNRKIKTKKTSFSLTGIDLIIDYIFKKKMDFTLMLDVIIQFTITIHFFYIKKGGVELTLI